MKRPRIANRRRGGLLASLLGGLLIAAAAGSAHGQAAAVGGGAVGADEVIARALADQHRGHWDKAWVALAPLADAGHRQAARLALGMAKPGPRPSGLGFEIGPGRLARWEAVASGAPAEPLWEPGPSGC